MHVVWFKRDLRIHDNQALWEACQAGTVLPLYILEPELWQQPDMSHRHYQFLRESLIELYRDLRACGQGLIIRIGNAVEVLQEIHQQYGIDALWSHQETWNGWTYKRDLQVLSWARNNAIPWHEPCQHGVVRRLRSRDEWSSHWEKLMKCPPLPKPKLTQLDITSQTFPTCDDFDIADDGCTHRQIGGRQAGLDLLESFFQYRGEGYTKEMSSPVTAFESCSRLSPYLAFGVLSMREVVHACREQQCQHKNRPYGTKGKWGIALRSFSGRLHWHCHFIQKLEDEPSLEFENLHCGYNGLRENDFNDDYFRAWQTGQTGYPMIDACMRALIATGWINFRMRAMLMSFASYHLWLHWRSTSLHLARLFTDYEPGIHYSQAQMQSGTTGINSIRVYNPIKQGIDQDPEGVFIRRWIPELVDIPEAFIHTPWLCGEHLNGYPLPIVDEKNARKEASKKVYAVKKDLDNMLIAQGIFIKHGSRKGNRKKPTQPETDTKQQKFPF